MDTFHDGRRNVDTFHYQHGNVDTFHYQRGSHLHYLQLLQRRHVLDDVD